MAQERPELEIEVSLSAGHANRGGAMVEAAKAAFDTLGDVLNDAVLPLRRALERTGDSPDEVELRLELALKGESKWIVISAGGQATASVKLVWKRKH